MYPAFIERAELEKNVRAQRTFEYADQVERIHYGYFEAALKAIKEGQPPADETYYVCQVCGNTVPGEAPEKCPICGAARDKFKKVE